MPSFIDRTLDHLAADWRAILYAKRTLAVVLLLLIGTTAFVTWLITNSFYAGQFAEIEATTKNLLIQVGQLDKESRPQSPQVYGTSRLQLLDIHVVYDPPQKPNIFGNVINKGALAARDPSSGASYVFTPRELTTAETDDLAARAIKAVRLTNRSVEFKPDEVHGFSLNIIMTQEQFESVRDGKQMFYLIYVMAHRDETVPAGKVRMTEACYIYTASLTQGQLCPEHNLAFVADLPAAQ